MNRPEMQAEELRLTKLIVDEGMRDGLQSMAEHPRYGELKKLQDELYEEDK